MTTTITEISIAIFPQQGVEECLQKALLEVVRQKAEVTGASLPLSLNDWLVADVDIDSLVVVEILCSLDEHLPFQVTECIVQPGGYSSISEGVAHLVKGAKAQWNEYYSGGQK